MNELINCLIARRKERGWSQRDLADVLSMPQSVIARFETKKVVPRLDMFLKVVEALDCEVKVVLKKDKESV